jgi:hypothetical protein
MQAHPFTLSELADRRISPFRQEGEPDVPYDLEAGRLKGQGRCLFLQWTLQTPLLASRSQRDYCANFSIAVSFQSDDRIAVKTLVGLGTVSNSLRCSAGAGICKPGRTTNGEPPPRGQV